MIGEFARFLGVGGFCTALQYLILIALVSLAAADTAIASSIGFSLSALVNYQLNRRYTFQSQRSHRQAVPRFAVVLGVGLLLTYSLMHTFANGFGLHYLLAQIGTTGVVLIWNFSINRLWTFPSGSRN